MDPSRPISLNDLQGSKMKSNLVDSVFSIGRSEKDKNIRYIKQLKVRDGELLLDTDHVKVYELSKSTGFLFFTELAISSEFEHLKQRSEDEKSHQLAEVADMKNTGLSNCEIARRLNVTEGTVRKWLKKFNESKQE